MSILLFAQPPCVFVRIGKTGSTSVVKGLFGGSRNAWLISPSGRWHQAFDGLFSFSFVRNPFDRLQSCLRMFQRSSHGSPAEASLRRNLTLDLVLDILEDTSIDPAEHSLRSRIREHALPMTHPSIHLERCQFLGRFERFSDDYREVAGRLGITVAAIPHLRRTPPEDYRLCFSPSQRRRAERLYAEDLEQLGYRFGA